MNAPLFSLKINLIVAMSLALSLGPSFPTSAQKTYYHPPDKYVKINQSAIQAVLLEADFEKGDRVVDIGAGNGWFDLALSTQTDSLTFYLEEIDSLKINSEKLEKDIHSFNLTFGNKINNTFFQTLGDENGTGLKDNFFDQALLVDTYHHFTYPENMIEDIYRIIKPGGRLLIYELIARHIGDLRPGCNSLLFSEKDIITDFRSRGFTLLKAIETDKHRRWQTRLVVFQK